MVAAALVCLNVTGQTEQRSGLWHIKQTVSGGNPNQIRDCSSKEF